MRCCSGILLYEFDESVEVIRGLDGRVAELALLFLVVVDGDVGVLQSVARQDAGDALVGADEALGSQVFEAGDGGRRSRLAASPILADDRLGIDNFLIRHRAHDAVADVDGAQALLEINRTGNLNR